MQLSIAKWGNSLAVRLPTQIAKETKLEEGSTVSAEVKDGALVLTPVRKRFKLSELLADMPNARVEEADWGQPKGEEAW